MPVVGMLCLPVADDMLACWSSGHVVKNSNSYSVYHCHYLWPVLAEFIVESHVVLVQRTLALVQEAGVHAAI